MYEFTMKQAAEMLGVNVSKVRYWDDTYGVIANRDATTNNRMVSPAEMKTFTKIKLLLNFFNSEGVKLVLGGKIEVRIQPKTLEKYG